MTSRPERREGSWGRKVPTSRKRERELLEVYLTYVLLRSRPVLLFSGLGMLALAGPLMVVSVAGASVAAAGAAIPLLLAFSPRAVMVAAKIAARAGTLGRAKS